MSGDESGSGDELGPIVTYVFYEKKVSKKTAIRFESAMGENIKISSLTEEVVRRNKRTSLEVDISKRIEIVNEYHRKLERSGYGQDQIRSIITAGLVGFERIIQKATKNGTNINRSAKEGASDRYRKKLLSRQSWFKKKGNKDRNKNHNESKRKKQRNEETKREVPVVSVIFVSKTKHSLLARKMKEAEGTLSKLTKERIRVVERSGKTISDLLVVKDLWNDQPCGREGCICCGESQGEGEDLEEEGRRGRGKEEKKRMNCFKRSLVYEVRCTECEEKVNEHKEKMKQKLEEEKGKEGEGRRQKEAVRKEEENAPKSYVYTGMSHLSGFERGKQHGYLLQKLDLNKKKVEGEEEEDNEGHMAVHVKLKHEGRKNVRFKMSAVKYHSSPFSRAVHEAVHLKYLSLRGDVAIMNGKSEMCSMTLPRLSLQTKSFAKNEDKEGGLEALIQTQNRSNHPEINPSYSSQQFPIPITAKAKVKCKLKQTLLSVHMKPKPDKQGGK